MPHRPDPRAHVLARGKCLPVTYFSEAQQVAEVESMHVCGACHSELVAPVEWAQVARRQWQVTLRCPECQTFCTNVFDQTTVDRYDDELERAAVEIARDVTRLQQAGMADYVERFTAALKADAIMAEDF